MRMKAIAGIGIATLALTLAGCSSSGDDEAGADQSDDMEQSQPADDSMSSEEPMDDEDEMGAGEEMMAQLSGSFEGLNDKMGAGDVAIDGDTVTLSDFSVDEGPDLHLYLTNGTDEAAVGEGTELGAVAFDEASQTFALDGVDATEYSDIVVHCDKAKAVFAAAELS